MSLETKQISIGIIDDDQLIISLLANFLENQTHIHISLTALDGEEGIKKLEALDNLPDILLIDLKMKGMNGLETMEYLKVSFPKIKLILISSHYKQSFMGFMFKSGVNAFLPKGISTDKLLEVITEVDEKGYYFSIEQMNTIQNQLSTKFIKPDLTIINTLSKREKEVLKLICFQKTAQEIGEKLFISKRTVEGHKNNLFAKIGAKNIAGLIIFAIQNQFIDINELPII